MGDAGDLLTRGQAARLLGVSVRHIYTLRATGELPALTNPHTKRVFIPRQAVMALKQARTTLEPIRQAS